MYLYYACTFIPKKVYIGGAPSKNALRANSEFPGLVRLEIPKPWKIKCIPFPEEVPNCATPQYGSHRFFFWRGPLHETVSAGHEMLNSAGGTSE